MDNQIKAALVLGAMIGAAIIIAMGLRTYFSPFRKATTAFSVALQIIEATEGKRI